MILSGCSAIHQPYTRAIEHRMEVLSRIPKSECQPIDLRLLGQTPPPEHLVDDGDILGVFIEGSLGNVGAELPVRMPDDRFISPAIGYPIPVRNGGTIRVPQIGVMHVRGMTVWQIEDRIRNILTVERQLLQPDKAQIHVSLMWKRNVNVLVVRQEEEDIAARITPSNRTEPDRRTGRVIELPAFRNDVLNALLETGGLPSQQAENAVYIFKRQDRQLAGVPGWADTAAPQTSGIQLAAYAEMMGQVSALPTHAGHSLEPTPAGTMLAAGPTQGCWPDNCSPDAVDSQHPSAVRIPLSMSPAERLPFTQRDVILEDGDIVLVESRGNNYFFTSGLLGGGQYALPHNHDIDVIDAVLLADTYSKTTQLNTPTRAVGGVSVLNRDVTVGASRVVIERKSATGHTETFRVNLYRAMKDPGQRVIIEPGDRISLEYTAVEAWLAFFERHLMDPFTNAAAPSLLN
ncbi:MAG: polysaccharide biosynthesis/export family protein [Planctomycetaceae bacterium]